MRKTAPLTKQYLNKLYKEETILSPRPPANACNTYRAVYSVLSKFEKDPHMHIRLETNILLPKCLALGAKLRAYR